MVSNLNSQYNVAMQAGVPVNMQGVDAEKVKKIYSLYIEGKSPQVIADILDLKYDKLVTQILTRKSNYGIIEYNGEEYQGRHQPIISKDVYDKAMECMKQRRERRVPYSTHLLTGLIICGHCGAKMRYQKWGKSGCKLICYSQQKSKKYLIKDKDCPQKRIWAYEIEDAVLNYIFSLKEETPEEIEENNFVLKTDVLSEMMNNKNSIEKKIKRLYNLYAESDDDILLETINEQKEKLSDINNKIENEKSKREHVVQKLETAKIVTNLADTWKYLDIEEQQKTLRMIINNITIYDNNINIDFK